MPKVVYTDSKGLVQEGGAGVNLTAGQTSFRRPVEALSSDKTLTAADSGKTFTLDSDGAAFAITLPTCTTAAGGAALQGCTYTIVDYDISSNDVTVVRGDTSNDSITGGACSIADGAAAGITVSANVITFVGGTSAQGDNCTVTCYYADADDVRWTVWGSCST